MGEEWRGPAVLMVGLCALMSAGCSGLLNSYRTGPDGLTNFDSDVRTLLQQEQFDEAVEKLRPENAGEVGDRLLQIMDEAVARHYAGDYTGSNAAIERAVAIIDDRYTKSVSKAVFSLATNDRILAYYPDLTENGFLHYYGALNYLALGDPMEAAVEARRLAYLLDREREGEIGPREVELRRALRYFTGIVFEAAGELNDAAVAYRHVWGVDVELDLTNAGTGASEPGSTRLGPEPIPEGLVTPGEIEAARQVGDIIVLVENGFVAHKVERGLTIPLFTDDQKAMDSDDPDTQLAAAACIAERELSDVTGFSGLSTDVANPWSRDEDGACVVSDSNELSGWTDEVAAQFPNLISSDRGRERTDQDERDQEDEDEDEDDEEKSDDGFYLMRVVWPEMRSTTAALSSPRVVIDGTGSAGTTLSADISGAVIEEYGNDITGILLKSVARAATKYLSYRGIRDAFGDDNETLGEIAGLAANAAGFIMERADTRSWHLLPASVSVVRLTLPAGSHDLSLQLHGESIVLAGEGSSLQTAAMLADESAPHAIELGAVTVVPGRIQVVTYRKWR